MTISLHRRGTAVVAALVLASALSILSMSTARADPLARPAAATAVTSGTSVTPPAGTAGRGGVALAPLAAAGTSAAAAAAPAAVGGAGGASTLLAGRGRVPAPLPSAPANAGWIVAAITAVTLLGGAALWWAFTRRDRAAAQPASVASINPVVESSDGVSQVGAQGGVTGRRVRRLPSGCA